MASNRSSTVAATRLCDPSGSAIEMPCAAASAATRSVIRPCARNHGAITRRSAPSALKSSAASATPGCGPVANATCAPAQRVPVAQGPRHRRGSRVGGLVRRADGDDDHAEAVVVRRHPGLGQSLPHHRQQRGILAQHLGLLHRDAGVLDHRGDVDPGVKGVGQQERHHDGIAVQVGQHVAQARAGSLEKRGTDVEPRPKSANAARHGMRHRRRPWVDAAVGRKYQRGKRQCHEACNPHSVLDCPDQRPLRGSAPSTGFAVHGAQPIDG